VKREREVRHKSEDIEDRVLLDAVQAIRKRVRVINRDYDIPYIAGYSQDGHTVFIDRHLPRSFRGFVTATRCRNASFIRTQLVPLLALPRSRPHRCAILNYLDPRTRKSFE